MDAGAGSGMGSGASHRSERGAGVSGMAKKTMTLIDGGKGRGSGKGGGEAPPPANDEWKAKLTRNREQKIEGTLHNLLTIFENDERLKGLFWLNDFSNQILLKERAPWPGSKKDEFVDADIAELAAWLQHPDRYEMRCTTDTVQSAVIAVARRYRRHPVREYLDGLVWDREPRLEAMLVNIFGVPDNKYARQASLCFAVSCVARILWVDEKNPALGAKVDFMLVLEGVQGKGKSTLLSELFDSRWYVETMEAPTSKDFYQIIQGCWGVEIGEMDSFGKADVTAVKVSITRRSDKYRAPYDRMPRSWRRECVFVGTTNDTEYLRDATGGRRFLPVRADATINSARLHAERDHLWAEAVHLFRAGFQYWVLPDDVVAEQASRYVEDSWSPIIERWLRGAVDFTEASYPPRLSAHVGLLPWTTTDEVLQYALKIEVGKHTKADQMRVAQIMKRIGREPLEGGNDIAQDTWEHQRRRWQDGSLSRRWVRVRPAQAGDGDASSY
jgi:predicted P-loop ATPase